MPRLVTPARDLPPDPWPEAEIVSLPEKRASTPTLLIRRRESLIVAPGYDDVAFHQGAPVISLFTGCGGMDIGIEQAGFTTVVQHESDEAACSTLMINRPKYFRHAALIQGDIRKTPTSMLLDAGDLRVGEAEIVCGGPPCQGFSTASSKAVRGEYDTRNDLVFEFLRVVNESRPKFFIMENVPGFVSFNKHEYLKRFLARAFDCYYELVYGLVDACEYGVPQYRCRFICMGTRRDLVEIEGVLGSLPEPQNFHQADLNRLKEYDRLDLFFREEVDLLMHAPGVRYFPDRPVLIPPAPVRHGDEQSGGRSKKFIEFYRKLAVDEPDRIVRAPRHAA